MVPMVDEAAGAPATMSRPARSDHAVRDPGNSLLKAGTAGAIHRDHHRCRPNMKQAGDQSFYMAFLIKRVPITAHQDVGMSRPEPGRKIDRRPLDAGRVVD